MESVPDGVATVACEPADSMSVGLAVSTVVTLPRLSENTSNEVPDCTRSVGEDTFLTVSTSPTTVFTLPNR